MSNTYPSERNAENRYDMFYGVPIKQNLSRLEVGLKKKLMDLFIRFDKCFFYLKEVCKHSTNENAHRAVHNADVSNSFSRLGNLLSFVMFSLSQSWSLTTTTTTSKHNNCNVIKHHGLTGASEIYCIDLNERSRWKRRFISNIHVFLNNDDGSRGEAIPPLPQFQQFTK